jgi:hypothetical protein
VNARDAVLGEKRFDVVKLGLVHGALGQQHDVDVLDFFVRPQKDPVEEIEVEWLGRAELEQARRLRRRRVLGVMHDAEVRLSHLKRPGQQEKVDVIDPVRPAATRRELVRADVDARQQRADIPRERPDRAPTRGGTSFRQDAQPVRRDAGERTRRDHELPRPAAVAAASVIGHVKDASETGAGLVGDRVQSD